jgi:hypothetical protein
MKSLLLTLAAIMMVAANLSFAAEPAPKETRCFEIRTYYAAPDKLDALQARFRDHTLKLFEKHGMQNIGYWVPVENPENKLVYILAFPSAAARQNAWKAFGADPEWQKVQKSTEANGRLVSKAESIVLSPTGYSPLVQPSVAGQERLFELRTYTAASGRLGDLNARFEKTTLPLFAKHGMSHIGYWVPAEKQKGAGETLIYIIAHASKEAADKSWKAFREDPAWTSAKRLSEINGPLTAPNGVNSVYLNPTDYSPMK